VSESAIRIDGLAAFNRNLKKLDADLPKALRLALNQAADVVVTAARPRVPRRSGRAAASIKAKSTRTAVRVTEGGTRAPYMPWLDYGGRVGRRKSVLRPFLKEGRYVYPAYFEMRDSGQIERILTAALLGVARQAGVEVD
jgi:hypothetical protein